MPPDDFYDDLTEAATEAEEDRRIAKRCALFDRAFNAYNGKLSAQGLEGVWLNRTLLINFVESYFLDIQRLKIFHGMERADRFKIAGFTLKWWCKIKPIQVGPLGALPAELQKRGLLVNADFALIKALSIAWVDHTRMEKRLTDALLYTAHYRDFDGGVMALEMETLAKAYPKAGAPPVPSH